MIIIRGGSGQASPPRSPSYYQCINQEEVKRNYQNGLCANSLRKIICLYTFKHFIYEKGFKFHFSLSFQDLTNFRSSKGCGCHFWNIQRAEHSFLCFTTFSLALLQCPFAQLALKCSLFILFCKSFLPSMHCKIIYWLSNPLIYELIITFYLPLIYALMIRGGGALPPLIINA